MTLLMAAFAFPATASSFSQYCDLNGYAPALRQTIIVLDESQIKPEAGEGVAPQNKPWRQFLGRLLLGDDAVLTHDFEPREHVSILIARRDGSGVRTVFDGCLPFYSVAEQRRIAKTAGYMNNVNTFFGSGAVADAKKDLDTFRLRLGESIKGAISPEALSHNTLPGKTLDNNSLIVSLKQGAMINPAYGVPRIVIYSDMSRFMSGIGGNTSNVRRSGEEAGYKAGIDLGYSEVYVVGTSGNPYARDALNMFFLASHAELISSGPADILPRFKAAPAHVARYQGLIVYPDNKFPIRIRIAVDRDGTVVNSWLSVRTTKEQFSPIHGVVTCGHKNGACLLAGDDQFAQIWDSGHQPDSEPHFSETLPFAGARTLEIRYDGNGMRGSISDPLIHFEGLKSYKLEFTASRQRNATF